MSKAENYTLTTGQFARLCNTTRDTLRHYNDIGILKPQKNPNNGYYYYSVSQLTTFYFINIFRSLQSPLPDIKECMDAANPDDFYAFYKKQLRELERMRREIESKVVSLNNAVALMRYMRRLPENTPQLLTFKDIPAYFLTPIRSEHAESAGDIAEDIVRHIARCNESTSIFTFPVAATIDRADFLSRIYRYKDLASFIQPSANPADAHLLPTRRVVACVCDDSSVEIRLIYERILSYIKENGLDPCSDFFSISMVNYTDVQGEHRYLKYLFIGVS